MEAGLMEAMEGIEAIKSFGAYSDVNAAASITDSDSDIAEDLRFEKLPEPVSESPLEAAGQLPVSNAVSEVLTSCATTLLAPGLDIASFARKLIVEQELEDTFYVIDMGVLTRLHSFFVASMPRVMPFYAVKCMPERGMMATLAALGTGFDCASPAEIDTVLSLGVPPSRIIFAHPVKSPAQIRHAAVRGINLTTFDTSSELVKLARYHPATKVLLRIRADDTSALCCLGNKYGAEPADAAELLAAAARLGIAVVGVSFHVGSASRNPQAFEVAIRLARNVFDIGTSYGFDMRMLDLGGGISSQVDDISGDVMGMYGVPAVVNAALAHYFPEGHNYQIIAEPGRYFAEAVGTLVCAVNGKRLRATPDGLAADYWLSDGLYGSFNGILYDHLVPRPVPLRMTAAPVDESGVSTWACRRCPSTLFGPTCDGADVICRDAALPELSVGDFVSFPKMGAYSWAGACNFNGIEAIWIRFFYAATTLATASMGSESQAEQGNDVILF